MHCKQVYIYAYILYKLKLTGIYVQKLVDFNRLVG